LDGLVDLLRKDFEIIGVAHDGRTLIEMAKNKRPDVIVADIAMPSLNGIGAARILQKDLPSVKIMFLTMHADVSLVEEAFRFGASGFVLKTCDTSELVTAIQAVTRGATYITPSLGNGFNAYHYRPTRDLSRYVAYPTPARSAPTDCRRQNHEGSGGSYGDFDTHYGNTQIRNDAPTRRRHHCCALQVRHSYEFSRRPARGSFEKVTLENRQIGRSIQE
jgi:CheY-like chemotaxis protein